MPAGLDRELIARLLRDPDPVTAAGAGYLLALLGDPSGIQALIRHWREAARDDSDWLRLVVMATASTDDDGLVSVLEEVYRDLAPAGGEQRDQDGIRTLYWTMRPMPGPNALRLRKLIRSEVGMDVLGTP